MMTSVKISQLRMQMCASGEPPSTAEKCLSGRPLETYVRAIYFIYCHVLLLSFCLVQFCSSVSHICTYLCFNNSGNIDNENILLKKTALECVEALFFLLDSSEL